jgi:hypothetical protein
LGKPPALLGDSKLREFQALPEVTEAIAISAGMRINPGAQQCWNDPVTVIDGECHALEEAS